MLLVFLGSGAFGLPTLERLHQDHEVVGVITAMPSKAGRNQNKRATPVGDWAAKHGVHAIETDDVNEPSIIEQIEALTAETMEVIAFGQKLCTEAIGEHFAVNLHASLLPAWRGVAPINAAIMHGDKQTGVSVISLAERMDAGLI